MAVPDPWLGWANAGDIPAEVAAGVVTCTDSSTTGSCAWRLVVPGVLGGGSAVLELEGACDAGEGCIQVAWGTSATLIGGARLSGHREWRVYRIPIHIPADRDAGDLIISLGTYAASPGTVRFRRLKPLALPLRQSGILPRPNGEVWITAGGVASLVLKPDGSIVDGDGVPLGSAIRLPLVRTDDLPLPPLDGAQRRLSDGRGGAVLAVGMGAAWRLPDGRYAQDKAVLALPPQRPATAHVFPGVANPGAAVTIEINVAPPALSLVSSPISGGSQVLLTGKAAAGAAVTVEIEGTGLLRPGALDAGMTFTRASTGYGRNGAGLYAQIAANTPRFGTARRLLAEGARTNEALYSIAFSTGWTVQGIASNTAIQAPDGSADGRRVTESAVASRHVLERGISITAGTPCTVSVAAKAGTTPYLQLYFGLASSGHANFDLAAGTVTALGTGTTAAITPLEGGWYLCEATVTPATSGTLNVGFGLANSATMARIATYTGTGAYLDVWCFQAEKASFASSRIPTTSAVVTRAADVATYAIPSAQQAQCMVVGTFMLPRLPAGAANAGLIALHDGTANNRTIIYVSSAGVVSGRALGNGVDTFTLGTVSARVPFSCGVMRGAAGTTFCMSGGAPQLTARKPIANTLLLGATGPDLSSPGFCEVGPLDFYPAELASDEFRTLVNA